MGEPNLPGDPAGLDTQRSELRERSVEVGDLEREMMQAFVRIGELCRERTLPLDD